MAWANGMKEPKTTVVMMTTASVVVTTTPLSLKVMSSPPLVSAPAGILRTRPNAIAPLIIPPYEIKQSSLMVTSCFFWHSLHRKWDENTAINLPTMMIPVIQQMKDADQ